MKRLGKFALIVLFALFWWGLTGVADFFAGRAIYRQWRANSYPTTTGLITHSQVRHASRSTGVEIEYTYTVDNRPQLSSRYRYDQGASTDGEWAYAAVRANPAGTSRIVHYNPLDPADAVLSPGLDGSNLFVMMFLTPFNGIGVALLLAPVVALKRRLIPTELPGLKVTRAGTRTVLRLPEFPPLLTALTVFAFGAFLMIFIVAFTGSGFHPSFLKALVAWIVVFIVAVGVFGWRALRVSSGQEDLMIDAGTASVSLPVTFDRKARVLVPLSELRGVAVRTRIVDGARGGSSTWHDPVIVFQDGAEEREAKLAEYQDRAQADRLALWLQKQLGLGQPVEH